MAHIQNTGYITKLGKYKNDMQAKAIAKKLTSKRI